MCFLWLSLERLIEGLFFLPRLVLGKYRIVFYYFLGLRYSGYFSIQYQTELGSSDVITVWLNLRYL